ncbi:hypothetical protein QJS66_16235 [Kocuria rhizophila]|nr:hypothetical protein QJS66_16235 [Kocuria rhizophila]
MDTGISCPRWAGACVNSVVLDEVVYVPRYGIPEGQDGPGAVARGHAGLRGPRVHVLLRQGARAVRNPRNAGPRRLAAGTCCAAACAGVRPRIITCPCAAPGPNPSLMRVRAEGCGGSPG